MTRDMHGAIGNRRVRGAWTLAVALLLGLPVLLAPSVAAADPVVGPSFSVGSGLGAIAVDQSLQRIYVVDEKTSALFAVDGASNRVTGSVAVPARQALAHGLAVDAGTHRVYVTTDGGVVVVDGPSLAIVTTLGKGSSFYPSVAVNDSTGRVFALRLPVPGAAATPITVVGFDRDGTQAGAVGVGNAAANLSGTTYTPALAVDAKTGRVLVIGLDNGNKGSQMAVVDGSTFGPPAFENNRTEFGGIAVDPVTAVVYLVDPSRSNLDVIDESNVNGVPVRVAVTKSANLGPVAVDPRTKLVYVTGAGISVVDAVANRVLTVLAADGPVAIDTVASRGYAAAPGGNTVKVILEDTVAPDTTVTSAPTRVAAGSTATIQFTGSDNLTAPSSLVFQCAVDGGAPAACTSPSGFTLAAGSHTVTVRAVDQAGNVDATPASATFTVVAARTGGSKPPPAGVTTTVPASVGPAPTDTTGTTAVAALPGPAPASGSGPVASGTEGGGGQTIRVETPAGTQAGPPGVGLTVIGRGFPPARCRTVEIRFAGERIGTATPDAAGSFRATELSVPGSAPGGGHDVTAACGTGTAPVARAVFAVTSASVHRNGFVTALHLPGQVPHTARDLGISALIAALLVLLVAFPSELFDNTLSENYDEVRSWFRFARPLLDRLAGVNRAAVSVLAVAVVAVLYGLLDPGFGVGLSSLAQVVGLVAALAVMTLAYAGPLLVVMRRRFGERGRLAVLPFGIVVAAVCVLASRLFHFQPGYLYGAVIGLGFSRELETREASVLSALSVLSMLVVSALAWVAWSVFESHAAGGHPGFVTVAAETALAAVAVSGIESTVIAMLPLRFMDGSRVMAWDRRVWAGLFALSCFAFVDILLRPGTGYAGRSETGSQVLVVATLLAFGLGSLAFWGYFRFRRRPDAGETSAPDGDATAHGAGRLSVP